MSNCPRDQQMLASNDVAGCRYYSCERCLGYWIPGAALHRVLSTKGSGELCTLARDSKSEIHCPDCRDECDSVTIEGCRLDICAGCHGIWLDLGEVQQLKRLFPDGSAVVQADERRSKEGQETLGAVCVVDLVEHLLLAALG